MTRNTEYRWLRVAGLLTLALAVLVGVYAWHQAGQEARRREDIRVRTDEAMARIEAEVQRMENAAAAQ